MNVPGAFSVYHPIRQHGVIGDRRTAALVASDGTLDWLCLPDYDGTPVFGALLDAERGGWWRIGPSEALAGKQRYLPHTALLTTTWRTPDYELELTDGMAWPEERRRPSERATGRVVLRRLRCRRGRASCEMRCYPADGFEPSERQVQTDRVLFQTTAGAVSLFGAPRWGEAGQLQEARILLNQREQAWAVGVLGEIDIRWTDEMVTAALDDTTAYWHRWRRTILYGGPRAERVERSAIIVHLLSHAPTGSLVAAPTSSLPERIGGDRNYDYRYAWIRDASLSLAIVALLGDRHAAKRYMDWIAKLVDHRRPIASPISSERRDRCERIAAIRPRRVSRLAPGALRQPRFQTAAA